MPPFLYPLPDSNSPFFSLTPLPAPPLPAPLIPPKELFCHNQKMKMKNAWVPFIDKKKLYMLKGFMVLKTTGISLRFKHKNGFWKNNKSDFVTFWLLSQVPMHIFQNRFLRWNCELKLVVWSTMNPIKRKQIFTFKVGSCNFQRICDIFTGSFRQSVFCKKYLYIDK